MEKSQHYYAVIIAGGSGTRLWPKSRKKSPKHLLKLFGKDSLLQMTYNRVTPLFDIQNIFIITNESHVSQIKEQLPEVAEDHIIPEPMAKGTAMAMATAAAYIHRQDPEAVIFNLWADQMFDDMKKFEEGVYAALKSAESGNYLVAIGVKPTFPHTGLGYIQMGEAVDMVSAGIKPNFVYKVSQFKEKPDLETAEKFIASGKYLWNTGLYCWSTKSIKSAFEKYAPNLATAFSQMLETNQPLSTQFLTDLFNDVGNPDTIDYEISEKADNIIVVSGEFGWSDVGDWKVVDEYKEKDQNGNAVINGTVDCVMIKAENNLVDSNGKMIAVVGLSNIVVIETENAILVCNKDNSQDVKKVVERLKEEKKGQYL